MMPNEFGSNFNRYANTYSMEFDTSEKLASFIRSIKFEMEIISIVKSEGKFVLFFNSSKKLIFKKV